MLELELIATGISELAKGTVETYELHNKKERIKSYAKSLEEEAERVADPCLKLKLKRLLYQTRSQVPTTAETINVGVHVVSQAVQLLIDYWGEKTEQKQKSLETKEQMEQAECTSCDEKSADGLPAPRQALAERNLGIFRLREVPARKKIEQHSKEVDRAMKGFF